MKQFLCRFIFFNLSFFSLLTFAQTSTAFVKGPLPSKTFINNLVGTYKIVKTDAQGQCPLNIDDEFIISYTTANHGQKSSVGKFTVEAHTRDTFYLGKKNLPNLSSDQRVSTAVQSTVDEQSSILRRQKTEYRSDVNAWLRTVLTFDVSYAPGVYLQIWQNSSVCNSFENDMPIWNGGSSQRLPDSCTFIEDESDLIPASFYCLAVKLNLDSLHAAE
ncbi:MAG TPA: hypothetical protein PKC21_06650 [Oligoflexia bacterium]|nr:hypothetical protein [Oligoflexia bacterium]HMR25015.1 hypothetical protein [Oligoflexia bacterium]